MLVYLAVVVVAAVNGLLYVFFDFQAWWVYHQILPNRLTPPAPISTPPVAPSTLRTAWQITSPTVTQTTTLAAAARCPSPIRLKPTPATAHPTRSTSRSTAAPTTNTANTPSTVSTASTHSTPHTLSTGSTQPTVSTHSNMRHIPPSTRSTASTPLNTDSSIRASPTNPILPSNRWPATQVKPSTAIIIHRANITVHLVHHTHVFKTNGWIESLISAWNW